MRITWRLIVSLVLAITSAAFLFAAWRVAQERERMTADLDRRAWLRAEDLAPGVLGPTAERNAARLAGLLADAARRSRVEGIALFDGDGALVASSGDVGAAIAPAQELVRSALGSRTGLDEDLASGTRRLRVHVRPVHQEGQPLGALVVLQDAAYVDDQVATEWGRSLLRILVYSALITVVTLVVLRWTLLEPVRRLASWVRELRTGGPGDVPAPPKLDLFEPLAREIDQLARSYVAARAAAAEEARLRHSAESVWTAERLKEHCATRLQGRQLVVVSNREPYMHVREGREVRCFVPASGLVTAIEPILRACGGTWIAHGSGSGDREVVDANDRVRVPPDDPSYALRRVWLTKEDEQGYYYGFSNEGLWPLCHIAHTRPSFRSADWEAYRRVNERFRDAVVEEIAGEENPCVLIQDYHFALLPQLIKEVRPDARVAIFWHIPWPNPEAIGICPWQREILQGLLAADLVGFHTQFHCNNFLETTDRALECRIDWERFAVVRGRHASLVKPFPISVSFTGADGGQRPSSRAEARAEVARRLGVELPEKLAIGVDRIDYTKGIPERFRAIESLLLRHPEYLGRVSLVQIGAPSRTNIERYRQIVAEVTSEAERINRRFARGGWQPIVLLARHHDHGEIDAYYRAADVCLVTSLHDGMNLVAKEYVAARSDELGALVLSRFAGASRELRDALIVNPYDVDQVADAVRYALEIDDGERQVRMRRLRATLRDRNVYRWAADLIAELTQIRIETGRSRPATRT